MTLIGFAFKIAAAPFHLWAPDAYQGAPIPSAAFIASGSKVASFVVLGKIVLGRFAPMHRQRGLARDGRAVGRRSSQCSRHFRSCSAISSRSRKKMCAASSPTPPSRTPVTLCSDWSPAGAKDFPPRSSTRTIYAFTLVGAFGVVALVRRETGGDDLADFAGLRTRSPLLAGCMAIFMLSLAGLPPLAGFFGKFYLFSAALRGQ